MTQPAAFLFDMDGLLLDTERLFMQTFFEMVAPVDISVSEAEAFFLDLIGTSASTTSARLKDFLPEHLDHVEFEDDWRALYTQRFEAGVPLRPHAREVLAALSAHKLPMAVVTSTAGDMARAKLQKAGLLTHFAFVLGGDEVSANKPDPAPYREGALALGFAPEDCVAFEDSDLGITSAIRAGCRGVQIPDLRPAGRPLPDLGQHVAHDLRAALSYIDLAMA